MSEEVLTIKKFHEGLVNKVFSAREALAEFYKAIDAKDGKIGAYLSTDRDAAQTQAEEVDRMIEKGEKVPLLAGVPLAVKDNIMIKSQPCTAGANILKGYTAIYDATVIKKLRNESVLFLGKTNMDDAAMGSSTETSAFKITKNPRDMTKVPGGSSGGSAAAVAGGMAVAALGSDTGGSIRQPADFCGIVGLKPTYGAVSRYGLIPMTSSLDQIGPLTNTAHDAAIMFRAMAGEDPRDSTSASVVYGEELTNPNLEHIREMTIGLPKEYFIKGIDKEIAKNVEGVIAQFKGLKIRFKEISLPHTKHALSTYYIIMAAEASSNLARLEGIRYARVPEAADAADLMERYVKNRSHGFGTEVKRRIILGTFVLSSGHYDAYYAKAQKVRALIRRDFDEAFKDVDAILTPVSPTPPFAIGEKTSDPLTMYLSDIFTITANLAGLPALAMPPNFQLIGKPFHEADILGLGQQYERIRR
jgi:aspartyl-tRNA(Asn)/glutamyl-tRNA(Gln) amidotransferase subunit A